VSPRCLFIDTYDLRYANLVNQPQPSSQAVMFCLMDVSGSMDEERKDIAKRFFMLLYLFLTRTYERIEVVFIRHHTSRQGGRRGGLLHSRESGGTVVSSALKLMHEVVRDALSGRRQLEHLRRTGLGRRQLGRRLPSVCRDTADQAACLPLVQYFAYVEIRPAAHAEPVARIRETAFATLSPATSQCRNIRSRPRHLPGVSRAVLAKRAA
jgi:uncharacterized protein